MGWGLGAIIGAGAAAGIIGGNKSASAQRRAAADANAQLQGGKNEAISYLNPYSDFGRSALSPLSTLLTGQKYDLETGKFTRVGENERMDSFLQSPGYKFRLGQGLSAIEKSAAARGQSLSGGKYKALNEEAQGIASEEYNNYVNSLFQQLGIGQQADTAKGNYAINTASQMAQNSYLGGMANANKYANISNMGFQLAGWGAGNAMQSFQGQTPPPQSGGGRYNPSFFSAAAGGMG